jgi:hypothetical protein
MITEAFSEWAKGFSGCDGGDLRGKIWVCGIEYAGGDDEQTIRKELARDVREPPPPREDRQNFLTHRYNQSVLKIFCALSGKYGEDYKEFFKSESPDLNYFKLNLFPLGFRTVSPSLWQECHSRLTGFNAKSDYISWCKDNRFPKLKAWAYEHTPRLILCTGKSYASDFFLAFGNGECPKRDDQTGKAISYLVTNHGKTLVAVTYFPGRPHGLNSDQKLSATGRRLAQLMNQHDLA